MMSLRIRKQDSTFSIYTYNAFGELRLGYVVCDDVVKNKETGFDIQHINL